MSVDKRLRMMELRAFLDPFQGFFDWRAGFLFVNKMCEIFKMQSKPNPGKRDIFAGRFKQLNTKTYEEISTHIMLWAVGRYLGICPGGNQLIPNR
ncbi:MAG: hypothetical protein ACK5DD_14615 [Cyclobacteriaceae bacterium]